MDNFYDEESKLYSDEETSHMSSKNDLHQRKRTSEKIEVVNDSEDELDAFMQGIESELKNQSTNESKTTTPLPMETHLDDSIDDYLDFLKTKGVDWSNLKGDYQSKGSDDDDDYGLSSKQEEDDDENDSVKKSPMISLTGVDHSKIDYFPFIKHIYVTHQDIASMSDHDVQHLRTLQNVRIVGSHEIPRPCTSFHQFNFPTALRQAIPFESPTVIQSHAIPLVMTGRDVIALAETGSGKTCAYLFPLLCHIHANLKQHPLRTGEGPMVLILAPTRELCFQIYSDAKKFALSLQLCAAAVYGGTDKLQQFKSLRHGVVHLLCATPGRLMDMIKMKALSLRRTTCVVLDEADRMLDFGFGPQVRAILSQIRPDKQTVLFSATFPHKVQSLANEFLSKDTIRITVGRTGQANTAIQQNIVVVGDEIDKHAWLQDRLSLFCSEGNVLIFVASIGRAIDLSTLLKEDGLCVACIHGMMDQKSRDDAVYSFKKDQVRILVATDLASRGLDMRSVKIVIEYDVAHDVDAHVHRIGRTGRAGDKGTAYTLLTHKQDRQAVDLLRHLEKMKLPVPEQLAELAAKNKKFRNERPHVKKHENISTVADNNEKRHQMKETVLNIAKNESEDIQHGIRNQYSQSVKGMVNFIPAATANRDVKKSRWDMKN